MTTPDPDELSGPPDWAVTPPDHPIVNDETAAALHEAMVDLTLRRTPMAVGDGLADLHALVSLLAQLHAWLPLAVATARRHHYPWAQIAAQLAVSPATARRRHSAYVAAPTTTTAE